MRRKSTTTEMMKEYIAESLLILMANKSFDGITIGEITTKAGVNRSTYYRNFTSKEQIIKFYYSKLMYGYLETIGEEDTFFDYLNKMFTYFYNRKSELLLIYKNGVAHLILEALNETFTSHNQSNTFDEKFKLYYHTGGIYNTFLLWFSEDMCQSPKNMSEITIQTLPSWVNLALLPLGK